MHGGLLHLGTASCGFGRAFPQAQASGFPEERCLGTEPLEALEALNLDRGFGVAGLVRNVSSLESDNVGLCWRALHHGRMHGSQQVMATELSIPQAAAGCVVDSSGHPSMRCPKPSGRSQNPSYIPTAV